MRIGPIAHGVLLIAALVFGYQTWTRDKTTDQSKTGTVVVWDNPEGDFESLQYDEETKSVRIEARHGKGDDDYLWGVVKSSRKAPKPPKKEELKAPLKGDDKDKKAGDASKPGEQKAADAAKAADKKAPDAAKAGEQKAADAADAAKAGDKKAPDAAKAGEQKAADAADAAKAGDKKAPDAAKAADDKAAPDAAKAADDKVASSDASESSSSEEEEPPLEPAIEPEPELITTTREFPVGEDGEEFRKNISALRALRDLGPLDDAKKEEYGLAEGTDNLVVAFKGGKQRTLIIGKRVFGGADRYMVDADNGHGYVISGEIMNKISGAEHSLGLKKLNGFEPDKMSRATIKTPGGEKTLIKGTLEDPDKGKQTSWADEATPLKPDLTYANFMDRVEKLRPTQYAPEVDPAKAELIASIKYKDDSNKEIGFLELYRKEPSPDDKPEEQPPVTMNRPSPTPTAKYYIRTEKTRVLGEVAKLSAERAHQDFAEMFGATAPPATPEPPPGPDAPPTPGPGGEPSPMDPHGGPPGGDPHGGFPGGDPNGGVPGGDPHGAPAGDPRGHGAPPPPPPTEQPPAAAPAKPAPAPAPAGQPATPGAGQKPAGNDAAKAPPSPTP